MEKGWYVTNGGKMAHWINSKGRSRCGAIKGTFNAVNDSKTFGCGSYRCKKCLFWLKAYGEDDDRI